MSPLTEPTKLILKNYNTPAAIAGVAPTLDYRFALDRNEIDAVSLTDKLTYTGANGTFVNQEGYIQAATDNRPRFDHVSITRQSLGLLVESSRTNLFANNKFPNTNNLSLTACAFVPNAEMAPDGTKTAARVTATNSDPVIHKDVSGASGIYTMSVFVKYVSGSGKFSLYQNYNPFYGIYDVNLLTTTAYPRFSDNWIRLHFAFPAAAVPYQIGFFDYQGGTASSGDVVLLWGAQVELGSTVSSFIPTETSTVTRTEAATISLTGLPATRTLVEKPAGCATISGDTLTLNPNYTAERVMVFPTTLAGGQITAIRSAM